MRKCFFGVSAMDVRKIQCDGDGGGGGGGRVSSTERERERELVFVRERKLAGKFPSQFGELFEPDRKSVV